MQKLFLQFFVLPVRLAFFDERIQIFPVFHGLFFFDFLARQLLKEIRRRGNRLGDVFEVDFHAVDDQFRPAFDDIDKELKEHLKQPQDPHKHGEEKGYCGKIPCRREKPVDHDAEREQVDEKFRIRIHLFPKLFHALFRFVLRNVEKEPKVRDGQKQERDVDREKAPTRARCVDEIGDIKQLHDHRRVKQDLLEIVDRRTSMPEALRKADEVLQQGVQGITDLINLPALINLDFADVQTVMQDKGVAHIGIGTGTGEQKCLDAVHKAVSSPLLETKIQGASHVILNVSGDVSLIEVYEAATEVQLLAGENANIIFGAMYDEAMQDQAVITVIATGLQENGAPAPRMGSQFGASAPGVSLPGFLSRGNYSSSNAATTTQTERGTMEQFDYKFDPNAVRPKPTTSEYKPAGTSTFSGRSGNPMFGKQDTAAADGGEDKIKIPPFIQNYSSKKK